MGVCVAAETEAGRPSQAKENAVCVCPGCVCVCVCVCGRPCVCAWGFMHWRRKWQPTPVFLLGESQGRGSLVCCHLWGRTESDTTEQLN